MSKYQEALDTIMRETCHIGEVGKAIQVIKELVDNQTPVKPKEDDGILLCGKCDNHTIALSGYEGEEWCCYACGQVIDWSDGE